MSLFANLELMDELELKIEDLKSKIAKVKTPEIPDDLASELEEAQKDFWEILNKTFTTHRTRSQ